MKNSQLLMWLVLFTMLSSCSFFTQEEERTVLKLSKDGKLSSTADGDQAKEVEVDSDEPAEPEISGPQMSVREMSNREMDAPEMPVREMSDREMPEREMPVREH